MLVRAALDVYLAENGYSHAAYDEPWTKASFFGIPISIPNTKAHRWAIMLHDLHHVATGFGTDFPGEGEISLWEARAGLGALDLYVKTIVVGISIVGIVVTPRRAVRALRASRRKTLFDRKTDYEELLGLTVGELRDRLGVPREGLAVAGRRLHPDAPPACASSREHAVHAG